MCKGKRNSNGSGDSDEGGNIFRNMLRDSKCLLSYIQFVLRILSSNIIKYKGKAKEQIVEKYMEQESFPSFFRIPLNLLMPKQNNV